MKYRIGDICEIINGQTPRTDNPVYWDGDIPWITPKDLSLNKGKFISRGERNITEAGFDSCSTTMVPAGTVLLTSRAPIGYLAIANNPLCTNQGFKSLIPNESIVTNQFLYYWLQTKVGYLQGIAGGSTFKELSKPQLSEVEIDIPEMTVQRHIVDAIRRDYEIR